MSLLLPANNRGISLLELVFVMAVMGITMLGVAQLIGVMAETQQLAEEKGSNIIDETIAIKYIQKDLRLAMVSMGNVLRKDDNGRNFFDFYPDLPHSMLQQPNRILSLSKEAGESQELNFLVSTSTEAPMLYDPVKAYKAKPQPSGLSADQILNTAGSLVYKDLNHDEYLTDTAPEYLFTNQLLLLRSPVFLRRTNTGPVDITTAPKQPSYLVKTVSNHSFAKVENLGEQGASDASMFDFTSPLTGITYQSVDDFFRKLPTVGGAYPVLLLTPVRVISYRLQEPPPDAAIHVEGWDLVRVESYIPKSPLQVNYESSQTTLIATNVNKVTFERKNLNLPLITFTIEMAELKR